MLLYQSRFAGNPVSPHVQILCFNKETWLIATAERSEISRAAKLIEHPREAVADGCKHREHSNRKRIRLFREGKLLQLSKALSLSHFVRGSSANLTNEGKGSTRLRGEIREMLAGFFFFFLFMEEYHDRGTST